MSQADIKARLAAIFKVEADEHLQAIAAGLLTLSPAMPRDEAQPALEALFRAMHTLKGAARSVGLSEVEARCQSAESLLQELTRGGQPLTRHVLDRLGEDAAAIARLVSREATPPPAVSPGYAGPAGPPPAPAPRRPRTIRLQTAGLDDLLVKTEDLLAVKLAAEERARQCQGLLDLLSGPGDAGGLLAEAGRQARGLGSLLAQDRRTAAVAVDAILADARRLRLAPCSTVLDALPAMARDLAAEQGKQVQWSASGGDIEVDRRVLEQVKDPLLHLVRNAVDHGIERPEAREKAGKPPRGHVEVAISPAEGGRVEFSVADDGRGVNVGRVREAAVRARLVTAEEARALPDDQALELVYRSGLTTSPVITEVSGRGLGMTIAREHVDRLGGRCFIETRAERGTTVRMIVPATIATFTGLLVRCAGRPFLLPLGAVERVIRVAAADIALVGGRETVHWSGHSLAVASLARLLGLEDTYSPCPGKGNPADRKVPCVLLAAQGERLAILVEEALGAREVLVKELSPPLLRVRHIATAGLLGTGEIVLILRPADLAASLRAAPREAVEKRTAESGEARPRRILVVDDSITTRTMEKNLLEAAGFETRVATDGAEAWSLLRTEPFDLVLSDVDMPRLDGFALTERIRADKRLGELPVVLVTALESREDRERGIEVGANAYVLKSGFDQSKLLEIIRRLI